MIVNHRRDGLSSKALATIWLLVGVATGGLAALVPLWLVGGC